MTEKNWIHPYSAK